jgi:membrane associated rhomboid family serine protease
VRREARHQHYAADSEFESRGNFISTVTNAPVRIQQLKLSYAMALAHTEPHKGRAIAWITWLILIGTVFLWVVTANQAAQLAGAATLQAIAHHIILNAWSVQPKDDTAISVVLLRYGAKENALILQGQYWRFLAPVFLHVNALHLILNMANFVFLGLYLERLFGHIRFLLIYLLSGIISCIASFLFAPDAISVGASGAILGLVGAYGAFIVVHRRAMAWGGLFAILVLIIVIGINLGIGFVIPDVDNSAHFGGLISGFVLGWEFTPFYKRSSSGALVDTHNFLRRWPLALLTILGTLLLAMLAIYLTGKKS